LKPPKKPRTKRLGTDQGNLKLQPCVDQILEEDHEEDSPITTRKQQSTDYDFLNSSGWKGFNNNN